MTNITPMPEDMLPLTPAVFNILLALADGEKHGYAIMIEVEENTQGEVKMGPGTLYGSIKRMLGAGLIEETDERPDPELDDERRRYYRLSGSGAARAACRGRTAVAPGVGRPAEARLELYLREVNYAGEYCTTRNR